MGESIDNEMPDSVKDIIVKETDADAMDNDVDIVFSSLPTEFAAKVEKDFSSSVLSGFIFSLFYVNTMVLFTFTLLLPSFVEWNEYNDSRSNDSEQSLPVDASSPN